MHTGRVISLDLAERLERAGVAWDPEHGDRFMVRERDLDEMVFVVSDMVVEVHDLPTGALLGFNGTTEWALDSVQQREALWLPREDQLREVLGEAFIGLEYIPGETPGYAVSMLVGDSEERFVDIDVAAAYARAALAFLAST